MKTKYLTHTVLLISMAVLNPSTFAQNDTADKPVTEEKGTVLPGSLTAVIADSASFSTLTNALKAAGLDTTLGAKGNYHVKDSGVAAIRHLYPIILIHNLIDH